MILGTGYNNLVANNYAQTHGGGIFIEAATFYNNTIAYNQSNGTGGLHQYFSDSYGSANLRLYNCLIYGNGNAALGFVDVTKFKGAYNSYIQSNVTLSDEVLRRLHDCYSGSAASSNPFEKGDEAATENNYRLSAATVCLNHGTEDLGDNISLPATDVDFTDRIKDCTVDIGAYERNNEDAVKADADGIFCDFQRKRDCRGRFSCECGLRHEVAGSVECSRTVGGKPRRSDGEDSRVRRS